MAQVRHGGFTFVEMLATLAIIAILTTICLPLAEVSSQRRKEEDLRAALRQIRDGLDTYRRAFDDGHIKRTPGDSGYPKTLLALVDGVEDAQSPDGARLYFLRRLPREPVSGHAGDVAAASTWGLRSYESPPDAPQPGKDVFDVYCRCEGIGFNGVPYREW